MQLELKGLKARSDAVAQTLSAARSARNRATRERNTQAADDRKLERQTRGKRRRADREARFTGRVRIHVPEAQRPKLGRTTARKLFHRQRGLFLRKASSSAPTSGGTRSIHYSFTARGFASKTGRRWRSGEAERAARYAVREDALEGGEQGWGSNIAGDRAELVAFFRTLEALERHDRANANVYIMEVIALDATLTAEERRLVVERLAQRKRARDIPYAYALHLPDAAGDQRNYHVHIISSLRPARRVSPYEWDFAASKIADINTPEGIRKSRSHAVACLNSVLEQTGSGRRYTGLSNMARGLAPPKTGKKGAATTWRDRAIESEHDRLRQISALHTMLTRVRESMLLLSKVGLMRKRARERLESQRVALAGDLGVRERRQQAAAHVRSRLSGVAAAVSADGSVVAMRLNALRHEAAARQATLLASIARKRSANKMSDRLHANRVSDQPQESGGHRGPEDRVGRAAATVAAGAAGGNSVAPHRRDVTVAQTPDLNAGRQINVNRGNTSHKRSAARFPDTPKVDEQVSEEAQLELLNAARKSREHGR